MTGAFFGLVASGFGIGAGIVLMIWGSAGQSDETIAFNKLILSPSLEEINHYHDQCMKNESNTDKCFEQLDAHMLLYKVATKNNKKQGN